MRKQINLRFYQDLLTHPSVMALPIMILIQFLLPDVFQKFKITDVNQLINSSPIQISYEDLNGDGSSERLIFAPEMLKGSSVTIYFKGYAYGQWNIDGKLTGIPPYMIGDFNNDNNKEVYIFTVKADSLLLNVIDYRYKDRCLFENFFLAKVNLTQSGENDFSLTPVKLVDLNRDGRKEFLFMFAAGYSRIPRALFALDLVTGKLISSPDIGGYAGHFNFADTESGSTTQITYYGYAPGNGGDSALIFKDTCSYLVVLDNNLEFVFEPIPLCGLYGSIANQFIQHDGKRYIASLWNPGASKDERQSLNIFDIQGNLIRKIYLKNPEVEIIDFEKTKIKGKDVILIAHKFHKIMAYDFNLKSVTIPELITGEKQLQAFDFDCDGELEFLIKGQQPDKWMICRRDLTNEVDFSTIASFEEPVINIIRNSGELPMFSLQFRNQEFIYKYCLNRNYIWKYPFLVLIYALLTLLLFVFRYLIRLQYRRRYIAEKNLLELKIAALQNQMDSHFTFNVLNTIGSAILQEQKNKAYDLLNKFSRMLRKNITDTDYPLRTLEAELEYVSDFLELQQSRFNYLFQYHIEVDEKVNRQIKIPKGCIQVHAENAVKHGIMPLKHGGKLSISVFSLAEYIQIKIVDNGIGRQASANNNKNSTHQGYRIMHSYYELLNSKNIEPITEVIEDVFDEKGVPAGTSITISIPVSLSTAILTDKTTKE